MRELLLKMRNIFVLLILFLIFSSGCDKVHDSVIPSVPFSFTINLTLHNELKVPGNSIFIPGIGYGGVIVYCEMEGSYFAFDATCTHEVSKTCLVENDGALGTCQCCQSQFIFTGGGFPSGGPATQALRQYQTSIINDVLRIYNYD